MNTLSANELNTKGMSAIESALANQSEISISVESVPKFVVISAEHYNYLRECEFTAAIAETKADIEAGRFVMGSAEEHLARISSQL
jgi:PHD/YefM family antitoxin component YafN of YafNO toxin-antitoxin module